MEQLLGTYSFPLVFLSVVITVLSSYCALDLFVRVKAINGRLTTLRIVCGSVAIGLGLWTMHMIGMLVFHPPVSKPVSTMTERDDVLDACLLGGAALLILLLTIVVQYLERRFALRQADLNRQRYDSIFEHNPDLVCLFDLKGRLIRTNPAAERITGYDRESFVSRPFTSFLTPKDVLKVKQCFANVLQGTPQTLECTIRHRDGHPVHLSTTIVPLLSGKDIVDIYTISKDITEQKRAERQLLDSKIEAERAARVKAEFLAVMSHEIRTPLNGVIGMSGILLETELNDEQREFVRIIGTSGKALLNVINDLLDFSKMDSGKMHLQTEPFAIVECLDETLQLFTPQFQERKINISRHVDASVPSLLIGDAGRLRQVLINLVGNAVKFTENGDIEVRIRKLRQEGEWLTIECAVRDSGIGIPKHYIPYLFEPFSQLDTSIGRKHGGTGLGLAISKKLVELMGGTIRAESTEGSGTTFTFTFKVKNCEDQIAM